jgi:hypothetical protein
MKTVYANSRHPRLVKWSCVIAFIVGLGLYILYMTLEGDAKYLLYLAGFSLMYSPLFLGQYYLRRYEIDEENDTITDCQNKKHPLHISNLTTASYKENKKSKYRSLFLHDAGVGFMDIRVSKEKADQMLAQLLKANPSIEVKHVNYL